jgi:hypothetical protein
VIRYAWVIAICMLFASCAPDVRESSQPDGLPAVTVPSAAPGLAALPPLPRQTSAETHGNWEIHSYKDAVFTDNHLILSPAAPGEYAWAIVDLGAYDPGEDINTIYFPSDQWWTAMPPMYAWIGLADYTRNHWAFQYINDTPGPVDFSALPANTSFSSPGGHAYIVVVSDTYLDLGLMVLSPVVTIYKPPVSVESGQHNVFKFSSEGVGDIVTYCPGASEQGGAVVRGVENVSGAIDWTVYPLYGMAQPLQNCSKYALDHFADGRLAAMAARPLPAPVIRYVTEDNNANAGTPDATFSQDSAVTTEFLPSPFNDPQFDFKMLGAAPDEYPHVVFINQEGKFQYTFKVSLAWVLSDATLSGAGYYCDMFVTAGGDIVTLFQNHNPTPYSLALASYPSGEMSGSWSPITQAYSSPPSGAAGYHASLAYDLANTRWCGAQAILDPSENFYSLGYVECIGDWASGTWNSKIVDPGGMSHNVGQYCSMAVLESGIPVIAYYDASAKKLMAAMAQSSDTTGGAAGEGWSRIVVDAGVGTDGVGNYCSLDAIHDNEGFDIVGIAYEAVVDGKSELRFAVIN